MSSLLKDRLRMVERSARVRRYHTEPVLHPQNVGEHTYGVMWLVLLINPEASRGLLVAALMHDAAEEATGDVPGPTKKIPVVKQAFDAMEAETLERLQLPEPQLTETEKRTLKLADNLEGLMFCVYEWRRGNRDIGVALRNYSRYMAAMHPSGAALDIYNELMENAHANGFTL